MKQTSLRTKRALAVLLFSYAATAFAGNDDPVFKNGGFAIRGYDPVAYHQQAQPVKGSQKFNYQWMGATWIFASAENRDRSQSDPERYAPRYGGYCAYAVSQGHTASTDPEAWKIVDGKLYLNYSKGVQKKWEQDVPGYIQKAETNWPDLHK